jgi:CRISPR-associated protein Cmr1
MNKIDKNYRIVTPMFIGDAKQELTNLRPPSIKGALRFWWRALNWGKFFKGDIAQALRELHKQEGKLFGQAAREEKGKQIGGQGCFLLQLSEQPKLNDQNKEKDWPQNNTASGYLGYGLMKDNTQAHREGFKENTKFSLSLIFKPNTSTENINSIKETLEVFGLLGNLGARSRRGFGSISDSSNLLTEEEYNKKIKTLLSNYQHITDEPPYTAFSNNANFKIISSESTARNAHQQAGKLYKEYRYQFQRKERIGFGLPLQMETEKRRSSPLFFHIHPLKNNKFIAIVLYLPAVFHPKYSTDYTNVSDFIN